MNFKKSVFESILRSVSAFLFLLNLFEMVANPFQEVCLKSSEIVCVALVMFTLGISALRYNCV